MSTVPWQDLNQFELRVNVVAGILQVSNQTVYRLITRGELVAVKKSARGTRISRLSLERYQETVDNENSP